MSPVSVQERPSESNSLGTKRERFHDICATPHSSVDEHVNFVEHLWRIRPHFGQYIDRRRCIVGRPATVVADYHAGDGRMRGGTGDVGEGLEAFYDDGKGCVFLGSAVSSPFDVIE